MRILIVGGTRFIGSRLASRLVAAEHDVAVFHRAQTATKLPTDVRVLVADRRHLDEYTQNFRRFGPDVVVDLLLTEANALATVETFQAMTDRLVAISSGDIYRPYGVFRRLEGSPLNSRRLRKTARSGTSFSRSEDRLSPVTTITRRSWSLLSTWTNI